MLKNELETRLKQYTKEQFSVMMGYRPQEDEEVTREHSRRQRGLYHRVGRMLEDPWLGLGSDSKDALYDDQEFLGVICEKLFIDREVVTAFIAEYEAEMASKVVVPEIVLLPLSEEERQANSSESVFEGNARMRIKFSPESPEQGMSSQIVAVRRLAKQHFTECSGSVRDVARISVYDMYMGGNRMMSLDRSGRIVKMFIEANGDNDFYV